MRLCAVVLVTLALTSAGCLAGTAPVTLHAGEEPPHATPLPPLPPPPSPPIVLRRTHIAAARYERESSTRIAAAGVNAGVRIALGGTVVVTPVDDQLVERSEVTRASANGRAVYMDPEAGTAPMVGTRMSARFDATNTVIGESALDHVPAGADPLVAEVARMVYAHLRVQFPDGPVRTGDRWAGRPIYMDTRGSGGWVGLWLRPSFELRAVDGELATIAWSGEVETERFCDIGPCLVGRGDVTGTTRLDLSDGFTSTTELRFDVALRAEAAPPDSSPILVIEASFTDALRRSSVSEPDETR
ncbi:MAG: hypothetical protein AB7S26_08210 [Sandaracinaceae bacterium]